MQGEREKLLQMEVKAARARGRARRGHRGGGECDPPFGVSGIFGTRTGRQVILVSPAHRCGQTELVQGLGGLPVRREDPLSAIDMSEYMEKHFGEPPDRRAAGVRGYDEAAT